MPAFNILNLEEYTDEEFFGDILDDPRSKLEEESLHYLSPSDLKEMESSAIEGHPEEWQDCWTPRQTSTGGCDRKDRQDGVRQINLKEYSFPDEGRVWPHRVHEDISSQETP